MLFRKAVVCASVLQFFHPDAPLSIYLCIHTHTRELHVFVHFHVAVHHALLFQLKGLSLAVLISCDLVVMNRFSFCLSGKAFLSPSFLKDGCLPHYVFLVGSLLRSELWAHHPLPFGPVMFLLRNLPVILRDLPRMRWVTFSHFQVSLPVSDFGLLWVLVWSPLWT